MRGDPILVQLSKRLDRPIANGARYLARRMARRGFLARLGTLLTGAAILPLLPMARPVQAANLAEMGDPKSCDYWRYCAFGGFLCDCCGGSPSDCPPGTEASPITWVGTCRNPADGRQYLISYNDCCGKSACGRCFCHRTEGEKPVYYPAKSSGIVWCFGTESHSYHCTLAVVVAEAEA